MKQTIRISFEIIAVALALLMAGCGGSPDSGSQSQNANGSSGQDGLTAFQQEHGIGPVTEEITLGEVDPELVEQGEQLFKTKCSACHKMDERYVGPALGDVLDRRTPTYVMNMILNPAEMVKKHPEAKKRLAEFMTPMPNQNLSMEEARAIVEYMRETD